MCVCVYIYVCICMNLCVFIWICVCVCVCDFYLLLLLDRFVDPVISQITDYDQVIDMPKKHLCFKNGYVNGYRNPCPQSGLIKQKVLNRCYLQL